eukprot:538593-Hanusia_phi.AAC.2
MVVVVEIIVIMMKKMEMEMEMEMEMVMVMMEMEMEETDDEDEDEDEDDDSWQASSFFFTQNNWEYMTGITDCILKMSEEGQVAFAVNPSFSNSVYRHNST